MSKNMKKRQKKRNSSNMLKTWKNHQKCRKTSKKPSKISKNFKKTVKNFAKLVIKVENVEKRSKF